MPISPLTRFAQKHRKGLLILGGFIGFFILVNYIILPIYVNQGSRLAVPRVVGLTLDQAKSTLDSARMQAIEAESRPDPAHPAGTVISQMPLPGAVVKEGRRIYLAVSGGEVMVAVPLLRGKSTRDARFALERNGFRLGSVGSDYSESFPENTVMDQSVPAERKLAKGSVVGITVSRGKSLQETSIPLVVGKTLAEAQKLLTSAGLKLGIVTYQPGFDLLPNTVVDQFPRAGEPGRPGQEVDLFVVKVGQPSVEFKSPQN
jgi:eukaryotic-like serine/threonine-protein kinase